MTATTAALASASSFLPLRYSHSMLFSPHTEAASSSPSSSAQQTTGIRLASSSGTAAHASTPRIAPTLPLSSTMQSTELGPLASSTSSNQRDHPTDATWAGVKYACASCIRGHRTSSCTHKDGSKGPLYPIRSKGRPPTQCEICRKKRKESGRHVRCDCTGKKSSSSPSKAPAATTVDPPSSRRKLSATTSNAPSKLSTADTTSSHQPANRSDGSRPSKKPRIQADAAPVQCSATPSQRRVSDAESLDSVLSHSSSSDNVLAPIRPPRAPHSWSLPSIHSAQSPPQRPDPERKSIEELAPRRYSTLLPLSSLMNPCDCRSAGPCTCCSQQHQRRAPISRKQCDSSQVKCDPSRCICSDSSCHEPNFSPSSLEKRSSYSDSNEVAPPTSTANKGCSGKGASAISAPSIELLLQAVDMSTDFVPPPCGCGDNCGCSRCLAKPQTSVDANKDQQRFDVRRASSMVTASSASPRTPPALTRLTPPVRPAAGGPGCDDCAACDLALERPSGIGAVDSWMEQQRKSSRTYTSLSSPPRQRSSSIESNTVASSSTSRRASQIEALPHNEQRASASVTSSVPTLHGGLLTSEVGPTSPNSAGVENAAKEDVRAELVLVHPHCAACLDVVRKKGVGVLSGAPVGAK